MQESTEKVGRHTLDKNKYMQQTIHMTLQSKIIDL
jgi:hypothetical protein